MSPNFHPHRPRNAAFTLVEIAIVLLIMGIVMPLIFSSMFIILRQQRAISHVMSVKSEGDAVVDYFTRQARSNIGALFTPAGVALCSGLTAAPVIVTQSGSAQWGWYSTAGDNISFRTNAGRLEVGTDPTNNFDCSDCTYTPLTTRNVIVSNLLIRCVRTQTYVNPFLEIQFRVTYANPGSSRPEDQAVMDFITKVKLRAS